jgi:hypothetical protein
LIGRLALKTGSIFMSLHFWDELGGAHHSAEQDVFGSRMAKTDPTASWPLALAVNAALYRICRLAPSNRRYGCAKTPAKRGNFGLANTTRPRLVAEATNESEADHRDRRDACKTVPMHAASDDARLSTFGNDSPLGAVRAGGAELGPISPELALVDPVLSERARQLLPDPGERLTPRPRPAETSAFVPVAGQPEETALPAPPRKRRWTRTVLLAGLVFAVGAASGGLLGEKRATSPGARLVVRSAPLRPPRVERRPARATTTGGRRLARVTWAANVLGVAARVDRPGVTLVWQRPAESDQVVVLRSLATRARSVVVYRGRATSYRDMSPRPCTAYRYTIVNYDRNGHHSTGVPTSVVTEGCA